MKKGKAVSFSLPSSVPRPSPPLELSLLPAGLCCLAPFQDPLSDFGARLPTPARASEVVPAGVGVAPAVVGVAPWRATVSPGLGAEGREAFQIWLWGGDSLISWGGELAAQAHPPLVLLRHQRA